MQLEFHQLDRRWEHLRVRHPQRQRRLLASLAESGQQTPIVVVAVAGEANRYVVIDGYKRIAALQQLGRDTVEAVVWPMKEADALLLDPSLRMSEQETALEQGWLLQELEQRFGYSLEELGRRFDRSVSWVSQRLALVELLPEAIQQQVREGKICAHVAMKFLVPMARIQLEDCQKTAAIFAEHHCDSRQAGQLYAAWRDGTAAIRKRILETPDLFLKAQRQTEPKAAAPDVSELFRDLETVVAIVNRAHRRLAGAAVAEMDYGRASKMQVSKLRLGLPRSGFFDGLDPEFAKAVDAAIEVLRKLTAGIADVQLPPAVGAQTVWGPETYAYHAKWLTESPEKYQVATRTQMIQTNNNVKQEVYAEARRQVDLVRREIRKTFKTVDLLITPTMKVPPATIAATLNPSAPNPQTKGAGRGNPGAGNLNSPGAFDVYGLPAITVPCGFTNSGLPIGLQISGAPFAETTMLALAHAYGQVTEGHTRRPNISLSFAVGGGRNRKVPENQ